MKYVFKAWNGQEQLFNLSMDNRGEIVDIAKQNDSQQLLIDWRQRLITQYEEEKRGDLWVKDGKLMIRTGNNPGVYSPNYPGKSPSSNQTCWGGDIISGDSISLSPNAGANPGVCQGFIFEAT